MLFGAAAAGIPIALHFFYRSRYRVVPWAAMRFLRNSIEQTSRRLRFQEILLLIARCLILALLALALARPSSSGSPDDAVDAVLVFDTSLSMSAREGSSNRLDQAKRKALEILRSLPAHSTVQVVTCSDRAVLLGPRAPTHLDRAEEIINELTVDDVAGDLLPGVSEGVTLLERGTSPGRELYVFSDMQASGWDAQSAALDARLNAAGRIAEVHLVRCGERRPRNAAIVGVVPQAALLGAGDRVDFSVRIRNSGSEPLRDLTASLLIEGKSEDGDTRAVPLIHPGETVGVLLSGKLPPAGLRTVTATVQADDLPADNRMDLIVRVRDAVRVLVIDGSPDDRDPEKSASYYFAHGLRPVEETPTARWPIVPVVLTPNRAVPAHLDDAEACVLVDVPLGDRTGLSDAFMEQLVGFVRGGKALMIFVGPKVSPELYNENMGNRHRLLPAILGKRFKAPDNAPLRFDSASADPHSFLSAFAGDPLSSIARAEVLEIFESKLPAVEPAPTGTAAAPTAPPSASVEQSRVILKFSNGQPAIVSQTIGDGEVILATTTADQRWSDWPLRPTYLPFVQATAARLLEGTGRNRTQHNVTAGQVVRWSPPGTESGSTYHLRKPDGDYLRLGVPETVAGRPSLRSDRTLKAGLYRMTPSTTPPPANAATVGMPNVTAAIEAPFAVAPDVRDTADLNTLDDSQIRRRLDFDPQVSTDGKRREGEWTLWILVFVLLLSFGEATLAWVCGRSW